MGRTAYLLGIAGLLPQVAAVTILAWANRSPISFGDLLREVAGVGALFYGAIILSFLGGTWWSIAMARVQGQAALASVAVLPALLSTAAILGALVGNADRAALIALGIAILGTLVVDRRLVTTAEVPAGWMALRVPLSLGLGLLTIAAGVLSG